MDQPTDGVKTCHYTDRQTDTQFLLLYKLKVLLNFVKLFLLKKHFKANFPIVLFNIHYNLFRIYKHLVDFKISAVCFLPTILLSSAEITVLQVTGVGRSSSQLCNMSASFSASLK